MRILVAHNAYRLAGGEDAVVASEVALLRAHGHEVETFTRDNHEIDGMSPVRLAVETVWSRRAAQALRDRLHAWRPDVLHVHNTFPLMSPSLYWAAGDLGVPVVQTLHNFRLLCPQAIFLREGRICRDCLGHAPWRGAVRGCYRGSRAQSTVLAGMIGVHRALGTWQDRVTRYVVLNDFCRRTFVEGGLPADRLCVKPNFVEDPAAPAEGPRRGFLYVGRLSEEKGIGVLATATRRRAEGAPEDEVEIIGSGPLQEAVAAEARARLVGARPFPEVLARMREVQALVVPSVCLESFPRTIVEAFAQALPVIASRLGSLAEIVEDGVTGLLFEPGDPGDLAARLEWARGHPEELRRMGREARRRYEALYTPDRNHDRLMEIYAEAMAATAGAAAVTARAGEPA